MAKKKQTKKTKAIVLIKTRELEAKEVFKWVEEGSVWRLKKSDGNTKYFNDDKYFKTGGRPSKFKDIYTTILSDMFSQPITTIKEFQVYDRKSGTVVKLEKMVLNPIPTVERFATEIGVHRDTVYEWANAKDKKGNLKHPSFSDTLKKVDSLRYDTIVQAGLQGLVDKTFAIFYAKNVTNLRDKVEVDHTTLGEKIEPKVVFDVFSPDIQIEEKKNEPTTGNS